MQTAVTGNNIVMSSNGPLQSPMSINEDFEMTIGDVRYHLIPNEEVVLYR